MKKVFFYILITLLHYSTLFAQTGDQLFNDGVLHEIHLNQVDTTIFIDSKAYQQVNIVIDGMAIDSIGFKKKGNISATHDNNKVPFKIKTNKYVSGKKYDGIKEFTLHNSYQDPSMLREKMTYDIMEGLGLHSLRSAFAKVYINGQYWGLYTLLEAKDELYERVFDDNDGPVLESNDFGTLCYLGPDQSDYYNSDFMFSYYNIDNGDEALAWEHFPNMLDKANNTSAGDYMSTVPIYFNVDHFFRYQAANVYLMNHDSYIGFRGNQLFYFDISSSKWEIIPWDFNASFGLWDTNNSRPFDYLPLPADITGGCIASKINEVPELETIYFNTLCQLLTELADTTQLINQIDTWRAMTEQAIYDDWRKEFDNATYDQATEYGYFQAFWEDDTPAMKTFVTDRWNFVNSQLEELNKTCETMTSNTSLSAAEAIKVFPNPANDQLHIEWDGDLDEYTASIFNMNGQQQMTVNGLSHGINISSLSNGLYVLLLQNEAESVTLKFAKMSH